MKNKIAILTSGHPPLDERIYWKFARSLSNHDYDVAIFASTEDLHEQKNNISINSFDGNSFSKKEKIKLFFKLLTEFKPNIIICCEPLTILSAHKYKKQHDNNCIVISDITEWYPNYNALKSFSGLKHAIKYLQYFLFNIYATNLADHLIIGEGEKARRYKFISPFKKQTIIGYNPPSDLFKFSEINFDGDNFTICYTGALNQERGFLRFLKVVSKLASLIPEKKIVVKIIGSNLVPEIKSEIESISLLQNVEIVQLHHVEYNLYASALSNVHLCIDLREKNRLFNHSLPIKIFDYMACGKPVIFSNLKSFYQLPEINDFGFLVDPDDLDSVIKIILEYIKNTDLLKQHSFIARRLFETKYNWELLENKLVSLIRGLSF